MLATSGRSDRNRIRPSIKSVQEREALQRSLETEILEGDQAPDHLLERAYRVAAALRHDPLPVRRILDIGCGHCGVLRDLRRQLEVEIVGAGHRASTVADVDVPIIRADATRGALSVAEVAYSMNVGHHLSEDDLIALIRNAGRYCRIIQDRRRGWPGFDSPILHARRAPPDDNGSALWNRARASSIV